jgi:hypothetical protein
MYLVKKEIYYFLFLFKNKMLNNKYEIEPDMEEEPFYPKHIQTVYEKQEYDKKQTSELTDIEVNWFYYATQRLYKYQTTLENKKAILELRDFIVKEKPETIYSFFNKHYDNGLGYDKIMTWYKIYMGPIEPISVDGATLIGCTGTNIEIALEKILGEDFVYETMYGAHNQE